MDIEKRFKHGELTNPDSIQFSDSFLKYYTIHSIELSMWRWYSITSSHDTTVPRYHVMLAAKVLSHHAYLKYADANRRALKAQYSSFDAFNKGYVVPQSLL